MNMTTIPREAFSLLEMEIFEAEAIEKHLKEQIKLDSENESRDKTSRANLLVRVALRCYQRTKEVIGELKGPTINTTTHENLSMYFKGLLVEVAHVILSSTVTMIHQLESQNLSIEGASEAILAQQKLEKAVAWFKKNWPSESTRKWLSGEVPYPTDASLLTEDEMRNLRP